MDVVSALRTLWRSRVLVSVIAVVSIVVGLTMAYKISGPTSFQSRQYAVGVASAQALVDTPSSQVADLGSADTASVDISTLATRAGLLANLMTTSPMKDEIAARAGIAPDLLIAVPPATAAPGAGSASAPGVKVKADDRTASILKVTIPELQSGQIPILAVRTQAPDAATAGRLATASIAVLEEQLLSRADDDKVPADRRVVVRPLGRAQTSLEPHGASKNMAIVVALFLFLAGCGAILGILALVRGWRTATEREREELRALEEDEDEDEEDAYAAGRAWQPSAVEPVQWPPAETAVEQHDPPAAEQRA